jgi:hypothetical protein
MTAAEQATFLCNQASKRISVTGGERPNPDDDRPATHLISGCFWPEAIAEINEAINELNRAKTLLAPLAENRPRD